MQGAGDELFAGAGFASNAHARFAGRNLFDLRHNFFHGRAGPYDVMAAQAFFQVAIFVFQMFQAEHVFDGEQKFVGGYRLFEKIAGAEAGGFDRHFDGGLAGHHHHGGNDSGVFEIFKQGDSVAGRALQHRKESGRSARLWRVRGPGRRCHRLWPRGRQDEKRERAKQEYSHHRR